MFDHSRSIALNSFSELDLAIRCTADPESVCAARGTLTHSDSDRDELCQPAVTTPPPAREGPPRPPPAPRRVIQFLAAAAASGAVLAGSLVLMVGMPGKSHRGPLPPLTP